jgi:hypothetical protein
MTHDGIAQAAPVTAYAGGGVLTCAALAAQLSATG